FSGRPKSSMKCRKASTPSIHARSSIITCESRSSPIAAKSHRAKLIFLTRLTRKSKTWQHARSNRTGTLLSCRERTSSIARSSSGGKKVKAKSFAMPNVEPGAIIEYRYREVRNNSLSFYERLDFQREIPVRSVKYSMKPLAIPGFGFQMRPFNGNIQNDFEKKTETFSFWMTNVPAFHEEPKMPPEYEVRPYLLVFYTSADDAERRGAQYWS